MTLPPKTPRVGMEIYKQQKHKLAVMSGHNSRTNADEKIRFPELTKYNTCPYKKYEDLDIRQAVNLEIAEYHKPHHGQKFRSNGVAVLEMQITASPEYFRPDNPKEGGTWDKERVDAWIEANVEALKEKFGDRLLQIDVHLDETTPHLHAAISPRIEYEHEGQTYSKFDAASLTKKSGPWGYSKLQDFLGEAVAHLGIERGIKGSKATSSKIRELDRKIKEAEMNAPQAELLELGDEPLTRKPNEENESYFKRAFKAVGKLYNKVVGELNNEIKLLYQALAKANYQLEQEQERTAEYQAIASDPAGLRTFKDDLDKRSSILNRKEIELDTREELIELREANEGYKYEEKIKSLESENEHLKEGFKAQARTISELRNEQGRGYNG